MHIKDHINKIDVEVDYNPGKAKGLVGSLKSKIWSKSEQLKDSVSMNFYQVHPVSKERKLLFSGSGAWLGYLEFEGEKVIKTIQHVMLSNLITTYFS